MTAVAVLAAVGDQRIGLLLALPGRLEIDERPLQRVQIGRHARQGSARRLGFLLLIGDGALFDADRFHALGETSLLGVHLAAQRLHIALLRVQLRLGVAGLVGDGGQLRLQIVDFVFQLVVQLPPALFPLGLAFGNGLGILAHELLQLLLGLGARHDLGPAIDHQQHQDQRSHRAQQHGQEGKRGNLEDVAAPSHAASPGLPLAPGTEW